MNKVFLFSFLFFIGLYNAFAYQVPADRIFIDTLNGISIKVPATWKYLKQQGVDFAFVRPIEKKGQKFSENITLITGPADNYSLDQYAIISKEALKSQFESYEEVSFVSIKINGRMYFKTTYKFLHNKQKIQGVSYITMNGSKVYTFTCSALESTFEEFYPLFFKIMKSIVIK